MSNQKHIVLAGGGTAGHVNPLLAVAHVIRELEPEADIAVVGTAVGLERDLVPQAGFELETIEKVPIPRRPATRLRCSFQPNGRPRRPKYVTSSPGIRPKWSSVSADTRPHPYTRPRTAWEFRLRFTNRTHVRAWPTSWARVGRPLTRCRIRPARTERPRRGVEVGTRGPAASSGNRTIGVRSGT